MKKIALLIIFALHTLVFYAQEKPVDTLTKKTGKVIGLQSVPEYPGGLKKFYDLIGPKIQRSMRYTPGKMIVTFIVETDGSITNITTVQGINEKFDERVREIIAGSPKWKPGQQEGKPIRAQYRLPLNLR